MDTRQLKIKARKFTSEWQRAELTRWEEHKRLNPDAIPGETIQRLSAETDKDSIQL